MPGVSLGIGSAVGEGADRTPEVVAGLPTTTGDGIGRSRRDELHHLTTNLGSARFGCFLLPLGKSWSRIPIARVTFRCGLPTPSPDRRVGLCPLDHRRGWGG